MMAKNHVDYSHKVHKGIEFKIHKEDMTAEDLYAIMAMVDKHHEQGYHFTCHSKDALVERKIHVNINIFWSTNLLYPTIFHNNDTVSHCHRFNLVMCYVNSSCT